MVKQKLAPKQLVIILGSKSDLEQWERDGVWKKILTILKELGVSWTLSCISADRNPEALKQYCIARVKNSAQVFVAAAGKAAILPSAVKSWIRPFRPVPVIGLALCSQPFGILDSLLSILSKPAGMPIHTFIDPINAILAACEIIAATDNNVASAIQRYHQTHNKREGVDFLSDDKPEGGENERTTATCGS